MKKEKGTITAVILTLILAVAFSLTAVSADSYSLYCIEKFKKDPENYLLSWEKKERFRRINIIND